MPPFIGLLATHSPMEMVTNSSAGRDSLCKAFHLTKFRSGFIKRFSPTLFRQLLGNISFVVRSCKYFYVICPNSGATAERINLPAFFIYAFLLTGFLHPVASRWVWHTSGWLKVRGVIDFGGGGCVHMLGGVSALVIRNVN